MAANTKIAATALQSLAAILLLVAICLTFTAMFTAGWLIAESEGYSHHHGLWKDCEQSGNSMSSNVKAVGQWLCFMKIDKQNKDIRHQLKSWQIEVLCLMGSSNGLALIALLLLSISCCNGRCCTIPWTLVSFLATVVSAAGIILCCRWASESENRFETIMMQPIEQKYGDSFWLSVSGCIIYLLATVMAVLCSIISCSYPNNDLHSARSTSSASYEKSWVPNKPRVGVGQDTVV